jgi:hypothetical protein
VRSRFADLSASDDEGRVVTVAIATPLETELVASIREVGDHVTLLYQPELLPSTRYRGDHRRVEGFRRGPEGESRWQELLARAEVLSASPATRSRGSRRRCAATSASGGCRALPPARASS